MGAVIEFVSTSRVDEAWDEYCDFATRMVGRPELVMDRAFMEALTRAHERWRVLFLRMDAQPRDNVVGIGGGR